MSRLDSTLTVQQSSQRAAVNWQSFSIGSNATVNFQQPNASAVILNRVVGNEQSVIDGALNANGQVFILNSNGALFSRGAQVNTGGLVASTLNLSDDDFMAGRSTFTANGRNSAIINQGSLNASDGGFVALLGNSVSNQGLITARLGTAVLAAGDKISLNFNGNSLVGVTVDQGSLNALVENKQAIYADGGQVILTAKAVDNLLADVVNNTGEIRAQTIANQAGRIYLLGEGGAVMVDGKLDASAPNGGNGGNIETSADHVRFADNVRITTAADRGLSGNWLIDPLNFTVAASGGDITGSALGALLGSNSVTIQTSSTGTNTDTTRYGASGSNGDIFINDPVSWNANTTLTLNAARNISINQPITATGASGALTLAYGQGALASGNTATYSVNAPVNLMAGNNFSTQLGSDGATVAYTVITSLGSSGSTTATDLQGMNGNLVGNYVLGANIDASGIANFTPVGTSVSFFTGIFDGLGHTISGLNVNGVGGYKGLFGQISAATVQNVGLLGGSVSGTSSFVGSLVGRANSSSLISNSYATGTVSNTSAYTGGLVGHLSSSTITNSYATGNVNQSVSPTSLTRYAGGLIGRAQDSTISNSYATGTVKAYQYSGGLVGQLTIGATTTSSILNSHAAGDVSATGPLSSYAGGLVGQVFGSTITNSYATGAVTAPQNAGGLVGHLSSYNSTGGSIFSSYATGAVTTTAGSSSTGGLVGLLQVGTITSSIENSYATGAVSATGANSSVGGLVGSTTSSGAFGTITNSYAIGAVSGSGFIGGLVGSNTATIASSYWNSSATATGIGNGNATGATGLSSSDLQTQGNFANWDFSTPVWRLVAGANGGYPCLASSGGCAATVYLRLVPGSSLYGSTPSLTYALYSASSGGRLISDANPAGTVTWSTPLTASTGIGTYSETYGGGISLGNSAYTLNAGSAVSWIINPLPLNLTVSKIYDGTGNFSSGFVLSGMANGNNAPVVSGSASVASANAATYGLFSSSSLSLDNVNYTLTGGTVSARINQRPLTVTVDAKSRIYGDANPPLTYTVAANGVGSSLGMVNGDTLSGDLTTNATNSSHVGTYTIDASGLSNDNYLITAINGNLAVTPAPLTVTANNQTKVYGAALPTLTASYTGFVNGDTSASLTTQPTLSTTATAASHVAGSPYVVTASGAVDSNYTFNYVPGDLVVTTPPVVLKPVVGNPAPIGTVVATALQAQALFAPAPQMAPENGLGNVITPLPQLTQVFGQGALLNAVSSPSARETAQIVTVSQARSMMQGVTSNSTSDTDASSDVRIPVSRNSPLNIVNGGLSLPVGIEQQLFVVPK